jgi:hypothetical protein
MAGSGLDRRGPSNEIVCAPQETANVMTRMQLMPRKATLVTVSIVLSRNKYTGKCDAEHPVHGLNLSHARIQVVGDETMEGYVAAAAPAVAA